jgi:hypothetical protein
MAVVLGGVRSGVNNVTGGGAPFVFVLGSSDLRV